MNVSKVSISAETQKRLNSAYPLSKERKNEIRVEGIKELIRSRPSGALFGIGELGRAAGYKIPAKGFVDMSSFEKRQYWSAQALLKRLHDQDIVRKHIKNGRLSPYTIVEDEQAVAKQSKTIVDTTTTALESFKSHHNLDDNFVEVPQEVTKIPSNVHDVIDNKDCYHIEFTLTRRSELGDYGAKKVASLDISDTSLDRIKYMIDQLIENVR